MTALQALIDRINPMKKTTVEKIEAELAALVGPLEAAQIEHAEASIAVIEGHPDAERRLAEASRVRDRLIARRADLLAALALAKAREDEEAKRVAAASGERQRRVAVEAIARLDEYTAQTFVPAVVGLTDSYNEMQRLRDVAYNAVKATPPHLRPAHCEHLPLMSNFDWSAKIQTEIARHMPNVVRGSIAPGHTPRPLTDETAAMLTLFKRGPDSGEGSAS